jgi:hypothetical protein
MESKRMAVVRKTTVRSTSGELISASDLPSNSNDGGDNFSPVGPTGTITNGNSGGGGVPLCKHSKMARTLVSDRRRMTEGAAAASSSSSATVRLGRRTGVERTTAVAACSVLPSMESAVLFSKEERVCCFRNAEFISTNQRSLH